MTTSNPSVCGTRTICWICPLGTSPMWLAGARTRMAIGIHGGPRWRTRTSLPKRSVGEISPRRMATSSPRTRSAPAMPWPRVPAAETPAEDWCSRSRTSGCCAASSPPDSGRPTGAISRCPSSTRTWPSTWNGCSRACGSEGLLLI